MSNPTTTTTTTTLSPLSVVQTSSYVKSGSQMILTQTSNASDSMDNQHTPLSKSFTFGTIAPQGTSNILVVALNAPKTRAIANIQLGLAETGDIVFTNSTFGYTTSVELRDDIVTDSYFQGVNSLKSKTSLYNIPVKNRDNFNSEYIYLNINIPTYQSIGKGMLRLCWFFDFAD